MKKSRSLNKIYKKSEKEEIKILIQEELLFYPKQGAEQYDLFCAPTSGCSEGSLTCEYNADEMIYCS